MEIGVEASQKLKTAYDLATLILGKMSKGYPTMVIHVRPCLLVMSQ